MKRNVNKVILIGNVGNHPKLLYSNNGRPIINLSLATNQVWRDKSTGELKENVEWHRIVFFDRLAEIVADILTKGSYIYLEGRLRTHSWTDEKGITRSQTEILASEMSRLCSPNNAA